MLGHNSAVAGLVAAGCRKVRSSGKVAVVVAGLVKEAHPGSRQTGSSCHSAAAVVACEGGEAARG